MLLDLTDFSPEPLHRQISDQLIAKILDGELPSGTELMSASTFAREQRVSRSTVKRAYGTLKEEGLICECPGKRFFVAALTLERRLSIARRIRLRSHEQLEIIESFSRELISVFETEKICRLMAGGLENLLDAGSVHIALGDERRDGFFLLPSRENPQRYIIDREDPFLAGICRIDFPAAMPEHLGCIEASPLFDELIRRDCRILFPLKDDGRLSGFIALGAKITGAGYSGAELNLFVILANRFMTALCTSRLYIEALEKRRMEEELKTARQIQKDLLPEEFLNRKDLSLAAYTSPSRAVGGDFYDYFQVDEFSIGLVIADASGNGMPAAMLISQIQGILKSDVKNGGSICGVLANLNNHLANNTSPQHFATLFYGVYDLRTGTLEYANAGHDFPMLVHRTGSVELLESTGPALGVLPDFDHETGTARIRRGDTVLFFTDGITETMEDAGKEYGRERLEDLLVQNRRRGAREIIDLIIEDLNEFQAPGALHDDRTLMVLKR